MKHQEIKLSWSNWGFGIEPLEDTAKRLHQNGVNWIELHGNRYGKESGKPAANSSGVKFLRMKNGAAVYKVGSGRYQFKSMPPS